MPQSRRSRWNREAFLQSGAALILRLVTPPGIGSERTVSPSELCQHACTIKAGRSGASLAGKIKSLIYMMIAKFVSPGCVVSFWPHSATFHLQ